MVLSPATDLIVMIQHLISRIEWILGGFFGLYLLYYIGSYFQQRKTTRLLEEIRNELRKRK